MAVCGPTTRQPHRPCRPCRPAPSPPLPLHHRSHPSNPRPRPATPPSHKRRTRPRPPPPPPCPRAATVHRPCRLSGAAAAGALTTRHAAGGWPTYPRPAQYMLPHIGGLGPTPHIRAACPKPRARPLKVLATRTPPPPPPTPPPPPPQPPPPTTSHPPCRIPSSVSRVASHTQTGPPSPSPCSLPPARSLT